MLQIFSKKQKNEKAMPKGEGFRPRRPLISGVLMLAVRMEMGFGVSVVVEQLSRRLLMMGIPVSIGCLHMKGYFGDLSVSHIPPDPKIIGSIAYKNGANVIVAHTSPFLEVLPSLANQFQCWAWEHGDPSPDFFTHDRLERKKIVNFKQQHVYHNINGVISISEFIRNDIAFQKSSIITNGCDHIPDCGAKGFQEYLGMLNRPLRIGTLVRFGPGEAMYKGTSLFLDLKRAADSIGLSAQFFAMGKGIKTDVNSFLDESIIVHLNASEADKIEFLRNIDIFVSCSLWEGCNLPLLESQALGTLGMAFDTGAHPEMTPFVFSNINEMIGFIYYCEHDRFLLLRHSRTCYRYVRDRFRWNESVFKFLNCIHDTKTCQYLNLKNRVRVLSGFSYWKHYWTVRYGSFFKNSIELRLKSILGKFGIRRNFD